MKKNELLAEGKTKRIWATENSVLVVVESKDDITAGDGAKHDILTHKAVHANTTTCNVFRFLRSVGVESHFVEQISDTEFLAQRMRMIPIECVSRNFSAGSYAKRTVFPDGYELESPVTEFFLKDDAQHDPLMIIDWVGERMLLFDAKTPLEQAYVGFVPLFESPLRHFDPHQMLTMCDLLERINFNLTAIWRTLGVQLIDMKVEFGLDPDGVLVLGDVIDNDSWRIRLIDQANAQLGEEKSKQVYRDATDSTSDTLAQISDNYQWVAEQTDSFG